MRSFRSERFWKNKAIRKRGAALSPSFFFSLFCFFGKAQNLLCLRHLFRNLVFGTIPNFDSPSYSQCVLHRCRDHDPPSISTPQKATSLLFLNTLLYTRESNSIQRLWPWKKSVSLPTKSGHIRAAAPFVERHAESVIDTYNRYHLVFTLVAIIVHRLQLPNSIFTKPSAEILMRMVLIYRS